MSQEKRMGSKAFALNTTDLIAVGKNALLVGLAAVLTYVGENIAKVDLGAASTLIVPIVAVAINTLTKWVKDNTK